MSLGEVPQPGLSGYEPEIMICQAIHRKLGTGVRREVAVRYAILRNQTQIHVKFKECAEPEKPLARFHARG